MKKFLIAIFIFALFPVAAYAQTEEAVIIKYDRAVAFALENMLSLRDIDAAIREIESQRDKLEYDISSMRQGTFARDRIDALHNELWQIEMGLHGTSQILQNIERELRELIAQISGTNPYDFDMEIFIAELLIIINRMISTQNINQDIAFLEAQRSTVFQELNRLHDGRQIQDMLAAATHGLEEIDRQIQNLRAQREQTALSMENVLRSMISAISEQEMLINALEADIKISEESLRQITILNGFGLRSANDLLAAERGLIQDNLQLEEHLRNKHSLRQNLNLLLGQPLFQFTVIEFEIIFPESPEDLTRHISEAAAKSPAIRQAQINADRAKSELQFFENQLRNNLRENLAETDDERDTRIALREAYARAALGRDQEIRATEAAMRRALNDMENLSTRKEAQLIELENAQTRFENILTDLDLGRATQFDKAQAELAVLNAKQNIERTIMQQWLLIFLLENPSLL